MTSEKIFADGFSFKRREGAPDFVIGKQSIKVDDAIVFLKTNAKNGWVNIDIKQSKAGGYYCELDTWAPKPEDGGKPQQKLQVAVSEDDDLPF
jgi:hypothetical protein